jgi:hypothetical protein
MDRNRNAIPSTSDAIRVLKSAGGGAHAPDETLDLRESGVLARLLATPDLFPMLIDAQQGELLLIRMSRETFQQSAFLDRRAIRAAPGVVIVKLDQLAPLLPASHAERPVHFIMHGAFCGSTLLARYMDGLEKCFVLREPQILGQFASLKGRVPAGEGPWSVWFDAAMSLLARAYPAQSAVVVKAPDRCNWMGSGFLRRDDRTKVVFLSHTLKDFLLQSLKIAHRRQWVRNHMAALQTSFSDVAFLRHINPSGLNDGQCAAAMWLLNCFLYTAMREEFGAGRILPMSGKELVSDPREALLAAGSFFGLIGADHMALEAFSPLAYHAKDSRLTFNADVQAAELRDAEARYGSEMRAAISWAETIASEWLPENAFAIS